jgi:hypothetical protein
LLKSPDAVPMEDRLRVFIAKGADQTTIILRIALYVKRQRTLPAYRQPLRQ